MKKLSKSKKEIVYDFLLEQFISRKYQTGDRINISQIATECNVSEIPVREALRQLEGDGYVKFTSNQGAFAIGINRNEISQLVQVKGVLEGFASRLSVDYLTKDDISNLREINEQMRVAMEQNNSELYSSLNLKFHRSICLRCGNNEILKILENLWKRWAITRQVFFGTGIRMKESYKEHLDIINLIEARDFVGVEDHVRNHKFKSVSYWLLNPGSS